LETLLALNTNKYKDGVTYTDAAPVIRYAEVVLNMAEAQARNNNLASALTLLNTVRDRALANPTTETYTIATLSSIPLMVRAILQERRIEFLMEGRRWSDIHRLQADDLFPIDGIPAKVASGSTTAMYTQLLLIQVLMEKPAPVLFSNFVANPLLETNNNPIESATKPGLGLVLNLTRVNIIIIILKSQLRYVIGFFFLFTILLQILNLLVNCTKNTQVLLILMD
jgi:hypothetical protein